MYKVSTLTHQNTEVGQDNTLKYIDICVMFSFVINLSSKVFCTT